MPDKKVIVLDPGHGFGAVKQRYGRPLMTLRNGKAVIADASNAEDDRDHAPGFYREDHGTLLIAMAAAKELDALGYEVHATRANRFNARKYLSEKLDGDAWQKKNWKSWRWIRKLTSNVEADAFVSIHTNAGGGSGVSAFYAAGPGKILATHICEEISNEFNLDVRRVGLHRYLILRDVCKGHTCLVECAFHDHPDDLALLLAEGNLDRFGKAIARGVDAHLKSLN